jgi:hypothetical protein
MSFGHKDVYMYDMHFNTHIFTKWTLDNTEGAFKNI